MKPEPKPQERIVVYIPKEDHRKLKAKLAATGKTVSGWFREKVKKLLEEE